MSAGDSSVLLNAGSGSSDVPRERSPEDTIDRLPLNMSSSSAPTPPPTYSQSPMTYASFTTTAQGVPISSPAASPAPPFQQTQNAQPVFQASHGPDAAQDSDAAQNFLRGLTSVRSVGQKYRQLVDFTTPHTQYRWLAFAILLLALVSRIFYLHAYYIVCYVLFIFLLNQFVLFLQPKDHRALMEQSSDEPSLPTKSTDEFRPFVRRLPEFRFWYTSVRATLLALVCTFNPALNVPVYWPILVMYFFILFAATMRRQWMDMRRFKYVPWDIGRKKKYVSNVSVTNAAAGNASRTKSPS